MSFHTFYIDIQSILILVCVLRRVLGWGFRDLCHDFFEKMQREETLRATKEKLRKDAARSAEEEKAAAKSTTK